MPLLAEKFYGACIANTFSRRLFQSVEAFVTGKAFQDMLQKIGKLMTWRFWDTNHNSGGSSQNFLGNSFTHDITPCLVIIPEIAALPIRKRDCLRCKI